MAALTAGLRPKSSPVRIKVFKTSATRSWWRNDAPLANPSIAAPRMIAPGVLIISAVTIIVALSVLYWLLANVYLAAWLADTPHLRDGEISTPPVTFLRPVKRDTPRLAENLERLVQAMHADDQL